MRDGITIRHDPRDGDLGRLITLHGEVYASLPGYGLRFEAYVAQTIAEYVLDNGARGRIWFAERDRDLVGCAAIALRDNGSAQLRWVLVDQSARGLGLGRELVDRALAYCRASGCTTVFLHTTDGLPESQALYEALGFVTVSSTREVLWDDERASIIMELALH